MKRFPRRASLPIDGPISVNRRTALVGLAAGMLAAPFVLGRRARAQAVAAPPFAADPFQLGVASGDPDATSVVLWSRLAPTPLAADGGMGNADAVVEWEVAGDAAMTDVLQRGTAVARAQAGHSIHVLAEGLMPGRTYWYRFRSGDAESRIGRTRTLPAPGSEVGRFRMAVASCQRIEHGHFTAWREIAERDVDLVLHAGDYIYEYALPSGDIEKRMGFPVPSAVRRKLSVLDDYRLRHALYKLDPDLAAAHAAHPFVAMFDDHEVVNNWTGDMAPNLSSSDFLALRAMAFQAYYENMPLREAMRPRHAAIQAFRGFDVGALLRLSALDTRQYRSPYACGLDSKVSCAARNDSGRTLLGEAQEAWLLDRLASGEARWNVIGNQVMMMQCRYSDAGADIVDIDKWDGYASARRRLLSGVAERRTPGLVVLTGDIHHAMAGDLKVDFDASESPVVGAEFICSSVASGGDGSRGKDTEKKLRAENPHIRLYDNRRGYLHCDFDRQRCQATFRAVDKVTRPGGKISTAASFTVDTGRPGLT